MAEHGGTGATKNADRNTSDKSRRVAGRRFRARLAIAFVSGGEDGLIEADIRDLIKDALGFYGRPTDLEDCPETSRIRIAIRAKAAREEAESAGLADWELRDLADEEFLFRDIFGELALAEDLSGAQAWWASG